MRVEPRGSGPAAAGRELVPARGGVGNGRETLEAAGPRRAVAGPAGLRPSPVPAAVAHPHPSREERR